MARAAAVAAPNTRWPLPSWAVACFFLSGAAGLLYEIVWSKQLAYLLGNSLQAVATVVAAFLAGLAIGARTLGVRLARRADGARTYARLELGVAVCGLALLPVLRGLDPVIGSAYRALGGETATFALLRFAALFVLLLPPAALMGATLPVLVGTFERERVGPALAHLYALNTFGAVAGSVTAGFALMPGLGLAGTTGVAAALNAGVAILAWVAGPGTAPERGANPSSTPPPASPPAEARRKHAPLAPEPAPLEGGARLGFALAFAASGFAALMLQIAWVRLFGLVLGSSVYSFSAVLGVYLLGLAAGSAWISGAMRKGVPLAGFALLSAGVGVACAAMLHAFGHIPSWTYALAAAAGRRWGFLFAGEVLMIAALVFVPCVLLGAAFPVATRLLQRHEGGEAAGAAYAINTLGTIAGSLFAGFFAVPRWGVQGTQTAALSLALAVGLGTLLVAALQRRASSRTWMITMAAVVAAVVLSATAPPWNPTMMSAGVFRPVQASNIARFASLTGAAGDPVRRGTARERVLLYREGINGSVLVGTDDQGVDRWLRVGGKVDASTKDMETQVLLGAVPLALADSGARALVIGLGSGITTAAALATGAGRTDVVELEPAVVEASRYFHAPGRDPLDDPRVRLVVGDARTHVWHGRERYDVVISEPSNPWIAGVNNLFTVDFYRRVKERLAPGGAFCQWMQLYELTPETFATMIASFLAVFPEGHVFCAWRAVDVLLVAVPADRALDLRRFESPAARAALASAGIQDPAELSSYYAASFADLRSIARAAPLNRDNRPLVEYRAPKDMIAVGATAQPRVLAAVPFADEPPPGALFGTLSRERWFESRAAGLLRQGQTERAARVARAAARGGSAVAARLEGEVTQGSRRNRSQAEVERASELLAGGRRLEGRRALESAVAIDSSNASAWALLADQLRVAGEGAAAERALAHARRSGDPSVRADAAMIAGLLATDRERPREAAASFREAQRENPSLARAYVLEARAWLALDDLARCRAAIERGLQVLPDDPALRRARAGFE